MEKIKQSWLDQKVGLENEEGHFEKSLAQFKPAVKWLQPGPLECSALGVQFELQPWEQVSPPFN